MRGGAERRGGGAAGEAPPPPRRCARNSRRKPRATRRARAGEAVAAHLLRVHNLLVKLVVAEVLRVVDGRHRHQRRGAAGGDRRRRARRGGELQPRRSGDEGEEEEDGSHRVWRLGGEESVAELDQLRSEVESSSANVSSRPATPPPTVGVPAWPTAA